MVSWRNVLYFSIELFLCQRIAPCARVRAAREGVTEYGVKAGLFKVAGAPTMEPPAVAPPAPPSQSPVKTKAASSALYIGQRVEAKHGGKSKWFGATVMAVNEDGTCRICYDGGMWNSWMPINEPAVPVSDIRGFASEAPPSSASSSFDHSPIRRASEEAAASAATPSKSRHRKLKKGDAAGLASPPERMTRAQVTRPVLQGCAIASLAPLSPTCPPLQADGGRRGGRGGSGGGQGRERRLGGGLQPWHAVPAQEHDGHSARDQGHARSARGCHETARNPRGRPLNVQRSWSARGLLVGCPLPRAVTTGGPRGLLLGPGTLARRTCPLSRTVTGLHAGLGCRTPKVWRNVRVQARSGSGEQRGCDQARFPQGRAAPHQATKVRRAHRCELAP